MIKFFSTPIYQLYLLQLENYELKRFWKLLFQRGYIYSGQALRKKLIWNLKPTMLFVLSIILCSTVFFINDISVLLRIAIALIFFLFFQSFFFSFLIILVFPIELAVKKMIIRKAMNKLADNRKVKIIGIVGSYGKTTMKNILAAVLSSGLKVLSTPDSVNTSLGIANWIVKSFKSDTEILILEMGEHYKGDIKELCGYFQPDFGIITGVNESHMERLKNIDTAIETIFELLMCSKKETPIFLNMEDKHILSSYRKYSQDCRIIFYGASNEKELKILQSHFDTKKLNWQYDINTFGMVNSTILGGYAIGNIIASIKIARLLDIPDRDIKRGIATIVPVGHRLEPIINPNGILIIDDSYNGNPEGVRAAIELLAKFKNRRKIFLTPGLVELGDCSEIIHTEIGKQLVYLDLILLINNSVTPFIKKGLLENGFLEENIILFDSAEEAHKSLNNILLSGDVILFQNDWGDQYI